MKDQLRPIFLCFATSIFLFTFGVNAQTAFWNEDFGTGCNQGTGADGVTTSNGTWTVAATGANDGEQNEFFISGTEAGMGAGNCADGCLNTPALNNQSLHIGADDGGFSPLDGGATYNAGGLCGLVFCVETHIRAESPTINCNGLNNITVAFNYMEGGDGTSDDATFWYYDGATWTKEDDLAKTPLCGALGQWTAFSVSLPASADNNPNVKIGFNWVNNDDGFGSDPSFAVDDIIVSGDSATAGPTAAFTGSDTSLCVNDCIDFFENTGGAGTSFQWSFPGGTPSSSTAANPTGICYNTGGYHDVTLIASNAGGSDTLTVTNYIHVYDLTADFSYSTLGGNSMQFTDQSSGQGVNSWDWDFGDGNTLCCDSSVTAYTYADTGCYNVTLTISNGICTTAVSKTVCVGDSSGGPSGLTAYSRSGLEVLSIFPNPFSQSATLVVDAAVLNGQAMQLFWYDIQGQLVKQEQIGATQVHVNRNGLANGVYLVKLMGKDGRYLVRKVVLE